MEDLVYFFLDAGDVFGLILQGGFPVFVFALIVVSLTLIGLNFSGKFADANEELINANPTTISNKVIFQITGVIYFILVTGYVVMSLISVPDMAEYFGFGEAIVTLLTSLFTAIVLYAIVAIYFQPERANLNVDKASSVAEDMIGLVSFGLKVSLVFSTLISRAFMALGAFMLALSMFGLLGTLFSEELAYIWEGSGDILTGLALLVSGAFLPLVLYLVFLLFYPIFNFWLAILHIPRIGK